MSALLGIDVATTGAKALLIDETGAVIASATAGYPLSTPRPLWSEQAAGSPLTEFIFRESATLLERPAEQLLWALALFPAPASRQAWPQVAGLADPLALDESLAQLEDLALVDPLSDDHYIPLPL